jgi:hypothetical protein
MTTISDANPSTPVAKLAVATEVLLGIAWTVVVFAAVLSAAQKTSASTPAADSAMVKGEKSALDN